MDCPNGREHHCGLYKRMSIKDNRYEVFYCEECGEYYIATPDFSDGKKFYLKRNGKKEPVTNIHTPFVKSKLLIAGTTAKDTLDYQEKLKNLPHIESKDFMIIHDVFGCTNRNHTIQDIEVTVAVLTFKQEIKLARMSAGYCPICKRYFLLKRTYDDFRIRYGEPLCQIYDFAEATTNINGYDSIANRLRTESILKRYGYSVAKDVGYSDEQRKKILAILIDNDIITKSEVLSYLNFFIEFHQDPKYNNAVACWEEDYSFVADYKAGEYTQYGVYAFYRS